MGKFLKESFPDFFPRKRTGRIGMKCFQASFKQRQLLRCQLDGLGHLRDAVPKILDKLNTLARTQLKRLCQKNLACHTLIIRFGCSASNLSLRDPATGPRTNGTATLGLRALRTAPKSLKYRR